MPRSRFKLAIPFVGKDVPSRASEFAHPDIIIGLTVLAYRFEGLRRTDFEQDVITLLRTDFEREVGPFPTRKSAILYESWVAQAGGRIKGRRAATDSDGEVSALRRRRRAIGDDGAVKLPADDEKVVVLLWLLKQSNDEQMLKLFELLRKQPSDPLVLGERRLPVVYGIEAQARRSGQELGGETLFARRIGFSGTPSDLLPSTLAAAAMSAARTARSLGAHRPRGGERAVRGGGLDVQSLLRGVARASPRFNALIDRAR